MPSRASSSKRFSASAIEIPGPRADCLDRRRAVDVLEEPARLGRHLEPLEVVPGDRELTGLVVASTGQKTSIVPLTSSGASEGARGGGGNVARSLCRANSWGSNGGRTVTARSRSRGPPPSAESTWVSARSPPPMMEYSASIQPAKSFARYTSSLPEAAAALACLAP